MVGRCDEIEVVEGRVVVDSGRSRRRGEGDGALRCCVCVFVVVSSVEIAAEVRRGRFGEWRRRHAMRKRKGRVVTWDVDMMRSKRGASGGARPTYST